MNKSRVFMFPFSIEDTVCDKVLHIGRPMSHLYQRERERDREIRYVCITDPPPKALTPLCHGALHL